MSGARVTTLPMLHDNYGFLVVCEETREAALVDPVAAEDALAAVADQGLRLTTLLLTHHHLDHSGGNELLRARLPGLRVVAHPLDGDKIPGFDTPVEHGETLMVGNLRLEVLHTPGHTRGHVAYLADGALFCGDTLFGGGCGRLFEDTPAAMVRSLYEVIGALPDATRLYWGHEYTQANLAFAATVDPDNDALRKRRVTVDAARAAGEGTVPSTLAEERATNPFLRCDEEALRRAAGVDSGAGDRTTVFAAIRAMKDRF